MASPIVTFMLLSGALPHSPGSQKPKLSQPLLKTSARKISTAKPKMASQGFVSRSLCLRLVAIRPTVSCALGRARTTINSRTGATASAAKRKSVPRSSQVLTCCSRSPIISAPTTVRGRLRKAPNVAAAKAVMMMMLRFAGSSSTSGAMRMPPKAASEQPIAQALDETSPGRTPLSAASSLLSTTALMATPSRDLKSSRLKPRARAMAVSMVMRRCQRMLTPKISIPLRRPKKKSTRRMVSCSQISPASERKSTISATVAMSCTTKGAVRSCRMRITSRTIPKVGAKMMTTKKRAKSVCQPLFTCSSQNRNAQNTPMAP